MVLKQIDHVVVLVRDLAAASADFERAGFTVIPGGEHASRATHNALIGLADGSYFELIAFTEPDRPQTHRWWPRLRQGEGFVDYALLSDDLASDATAFQKRGLAARGPEDGGRRRPDGAELRWRSLLLGRGVAHAALPFVIEDVTQRDLRVPGGAETRHRLAVTGLTEVTAVVTDLVAATTAFTAILGEPLQRERTPDGQLIRFRLGSQRIVLLRPDDGTSGAQQLAARGEGLSMVTLATEREAASGTTTLPLDLTHGALVRLMR